MNSKSLSQYWNNFQTLKFFNRVTDVLFQLLIIFVVLILGIGLPRLFLESWEVLARDNLKEAFGFIVTNLLTFFIILELFKSMVEYFRVHHLRLTFIVDATLVFILRDVMIDLYQHQSSPLHLAALAFLTLVLTVLRTLAIMYSPMEQKLTDHLRHYVSEKSRPGGKDPSRKIENGFSANDLQT